MKLKLIRLLSLILVMFTMSLPVMAGSDDYYTQVTAHAVGEGKVYVSTTNQAPASGNYKTSKHEVNQHDNSDKSHDYYLYALANQGYYFDGWYTNENCTQGRNMNIPNHVTVTANSRGQSNGKEEHRYAKFVAFEPVTFSVAAGNYYEPQSVTLSCATSGVTIKYSFDNSSWQTYSEAISVDATKTIYARAEKNQGQSNVYSAAYTILSKNSVVFVTEISIPYADGEYTLTQGTSGSVDVMTDGTVTASVESTDPIVTVSGSTITPAAVGTTTITVTSAEGPTYLAGNGTITVNVTAPEGVSETPGDEYTEDYTIPSSGYGTYCSQYPIDFTRSFENGETAYTVREMTETLVKLKKIEETSIKGGVGFVVKGEPRTTITFRFTNSSNVPSPNMLFGIIAPTYIEQESAYGMKNGSFHPNNAGVVPAHRAYLPVESSGSVKALTLEFEEEDPTGIEEFKFEDDSNSVIYNLSGQRINKMQKGINIVNGKKILF